MVDWSILPNILEMWWGPTKVVYFESESRWFGDSTWRWWGHLTSILHNWIFCTKSGGEQNTKIFAHTLAHCRAIRNFRGNANCGSGSGSGSEIESVSEWPSDQATFVEFTQLFFLVWCSPDWADLALLVRWIVFIHISKDKHKHKSKDLHNKYQKKTLIQILKRWKSQCKKSEKNPIIIKAKFCVKLCTLWMDLKVELQLLNYICLSTVAWLHLLDYSCLTTVQLCFISLQLCHVSCGPCERKMFYSVKKLIILLC